VKRITIGYLTIRSEADLELFKSISFNPFPWTWTLLPAENPPDIVSAPEHTA